MLHNRRSFYLLGERTLQERQRDGRPVTVVYFDLDGLKRVNDRLGHEVGSQLVVDFANLLRANFRGSDLGARVGGDEFAVVTRNTQAELVHCNAWMWQLQVFVWWTSRYIESLTTRSTIRTHARLFRVVAFDRSADSRSEPKG